MNVKNEHNGEHRSEKAERIRTEGGEYILPAIDEKVKCPVCYEGILSINRTVYKLPDGDDILIFVVICPKCGYKSRDIIPLKTAFKPGTFIIKVKEGDLTPKIYRSPTGHIYIPEADFEIEPGAGASYMITNIEGILRRMLFWAENMLKAVKADASESGAPHTYDKAIEKIEYTVKLLKEFLEGKKPFTLILRDEVGGSWISAPEGSVEYKPSEEEGQGSE